jgi:hypothetical protein
MIIGQFVLEHSFIHPIHSFKTSNFTIYLGLCISDLYRSSCVVCFRFSLAYLLLVDLAQDLSVLSICSATSLDFFVICTYT